MFVSYWNLKSDVQRIEHEAKVKLCSLTHFKEITLFALKIISFLTLIFPLVCLIGFFAQREAEIRLEAITKEVSEGEVENKTPLKVLQKEPKVVPTKIPPVDFDDPDLEAKKTLALEVFDMMDTSGFRHNKEGFLVEEMAWIKAGPHEIGSPETKVHISIGRGVENHRKAFQLIIPIIAKYKIALWKMANPVVYTHKGSNLLGKEFVIYFGESEKGCAHKFIQEVDLALQSNGVERGVAPKADIPISQHGYIFSRSERSFINSYIYAATLEKMGFTRDEAALISGDSFFLKDVKLIFPLIEFDFVSSKESDLSQKILQQFNKDIFSDLLTPRVKDPGDYKPFQPQGAGVYSFMYGGKRYLNIRYSPCFRAFFPLLEDIKNNHDIRFSDLTDKWSDEMFGKCFLNESEFQSILKDASIELAHQYQERGISEDTQSGNILPAIYHGVLTPFNKKFPHCSFKTPTREQVVQIINENRDFIIRYIVSCGLRDRTKSQIGSATPILLGD